MSREKDPQDLKFSLTLKLQNTNEGYGSVKTISEIEVSQMLNLDTDAPKRKILNAVEDILEQAEREFQETVHHTDKLTDGEIEREKKKEQSA